MINYLKYEIKSCLKTYYYFLIGFFIFYLSLTLTFAISINIIEKQYLSTFSLILQFLSLITFIASLGLFFGYIFFLINYYRKDFYTDKKYLKFTLPINGKEYFSSKIISIFIWTIALIFTQVIIFWIVYFLFFRNSFSELLKNYPIVFQGMNIGITPIILNLIYYLINFVIYTIIIYFSITLTKSILKDDKKGYIWFIFFFVIVWIKRFLILIVSKILPMSLYIKKSIVITNEYLEDLLHIKVNANTISINIAGLILTFIITIVFYLLSIKLIDD